MVKVKGSKDGKIITARFEGKSKSLFPTLKQTKALVLLSIRGNQFCTGRYLKAIIETACSEHEFTTFLIADEVYWHNLCMDFSEKNLFLLKRQAIDMGQTYFEEHLEYFLQPLKMSTSEFDTTLVEQFPLNKQSTLNKLAGKRSNFEVVFWKDWLEKSQDFSSRKKEIMDLYATDDSLKKSVEYVASDYARRHRNESTPVELLVEQSTRYLINESPAVIWIAASLEYNFIVYPGEIIKSFESTKKHFITNMSCSENKDLLVKTDNPDLLVNWLEVSFQRSREKDFIDQKNYPKTLTTNIKDNNNRANEMSAIIKGVTEGIFSLEIDDERKIQILTDLLVCYQEKCIPSCQ